MSSSVKDRLLDVHTQIQANALQVHSNKLQCQRLSSLIDQLIDPLERLEHAALVFLRQETRRILNNFLQRLDDWNHFIEQLNSSTQYCEDVYEHYEKFEELNRRLSQFGQDLCLGLNIEEIFERTQDQDDQKQDLQDLSIKINQMLQQRYKFIDQTIAQRFQSFRYHLENKILTQHDSAHAKTFLDEQNHSLHIPFKDLSIKEKPIGTGGFADAYKGLWLTHQDEVAIKVLRLNHFSDILKLGFIVEVTKKLDFF